MWIFLQVDGFSRLGQVLIKASSQAVLVCKRLSRNLRLAVFMRHYWMSDCLHLIKTLTHRPLPLNLG